MSTQEATVWPSLPVDLKTQIQTELTQLLSEALHDLYPDPGHSSTSQSGDLQIYIRQSIVHQVLSNQASQQMQLDMKHHALRLGWPEALIDIVELDTGR